MTGTPPPVVTRVAEARGSRPLTWRRPECGLSAAERWAIRLADGSSVFVKAAVDADTSRWLATERQALDLVGGRFGPAVLDWLDGNQWPVLVTEDLSEAYWPAGTGVTRWRPGDMAAVIDRLADLRALPAPDALAAIATPPARWAQLLAGDDLVRTGLCSRVWARANGPALVAADTDPDPVPTCLVHGDVRSDNLCLTGDGAVWFVDWSNTGAGHPFHDLTTLLPTLRLEGGPAPADVLVQPVEVIVRAAGATAYRAVHGTSGPDWLQAVMLRLAAIGLTWVSAALGCAPPDGPRAADWI